MIILKSTDSFLNCYYVNIFFIWFLFQDTFDVQILMARSVKHCINFKEVKEEDLHRLAEKTP